MPITDPIYSIKPNTQVYHNHTACTERNNIETVNVRAGTGGKRLCERCQTYRIIDINNAAKMLTCVGLYGGLFVSTP